MGSSLRYEPMGIIVWSGGYLEKVTNHTCPRCGQSAMNVYYSDQTDNRVGAWCEYCNMKAYYHGEVLVPIGL